MGKVKEKTPKRSAWEIQQLTKAMCCPKRKGEYNGKEVHRHTSKNGESPGKPSGVKNSPRTNGWNPQLSCYEDKTSEITQSDKNKQKIIQE